MTNVRVLVILATMVLVIMEFTSASQQASPIVVDYSTAISADSFGPHAEPFLALDPTRPSTMLTSSLSIERGKFASVLYRTQDGGKHWRRVSFLNKSDSEMVIGGDATVYFNSHGIAFFQTTSSNGGLWMARSLDRGRTWTRSRFIRVTASFDRPFIGFDTRASENMYLDGAVLLETPPRAAALAVMSSPDQGVTFTSPRLVGVTDLRRPLPFFFVGNIAVTPTGTLVVPVLVKYVTRNGSAGTESAGNALVEIFASRDAGASFTGPHLVAQYDTYAMPIRTELETFAGPRIAIDMSSGAYRGRIYMTWPQNDGKSTKVRLAHSSDDGSTWSRPVSVNDNKIPANHSNPAIAVNNQGVLAVIWNDRRASFGNSCYRLYAAASLDGGSTLVGNVPVRTGATCPGSAENWSSAAVFVRQNDEKDNDPTKKDVYILLVPARWPNGGETQGLVADPAGKFRAAWIDGESGVMKLEYSSFTVLGNVVGPSPGPVGSLTKADQTKPPLTAPGLRMEVSDYRFDARAKTLTLLSQLYNASSLPIAGPLSLRVERVRGNLRLQAVNADYEGTKGCAIWSFRRPAAGSSLRPGEGTESKALRFRFKSLPERPTPPVLILKILQGQNSC